MPLYAATDSPAAIKIPFQISSELGTVEEFHRGNSGKTMIYIQDAHDSLEAQVHIAKLIENLVQNYHVKTVFEEGYQGELPTDKFFSFIKDAKIKEKVSYFLLDQLRLGGAEYAHINRSQDFKLIGIERFKLYKENLNWYQQAAKKQKVIDEDLNELLKQITKLGHQYFPKDLKAWLKLKEKFIQNQTPVLDYLKELQKFSLKNVNPRDFAVCYPFITLVLSASQSKDPELENELKKIDSKVLFGEIATLESDFSKDLLVSDRDREIFNSYQDIVLLKRLNQIELTEAEYEAAKEILNRIKTEKILKFVVSQTKKPLVLFREWERSIRYAQKFYEAAKERDESIESQINGFKASEENTSILVFGGFHSTKIKEMLKRSDMSYLVVSPKITAIDQRHKDYYKHLMITGHQPFETPFQVSRAAKQAILFFASELGIKLELRAITAAVEEYATQLSDVPFAEVDRELLRRIIVARLRQKPNTKQKARRRAETRIDSKQNLKHLEEILFGARRSESDLSERIQAAIILGHEYLGSPKRPNNLGKKFFTLVARGDEPEIVLQAAKALDQNGILMSRKFLERLLGTDLTKALLMDLIFHKFRPKFYEPLKIEELAFSEIVNSRLYQGRQKAAALVAQHPVWEDAYRSLYRSGVNYLRAPSFSGDWGRKRYLLEAIERNRTAFDPIEQSILDALTSDFAMSVAYRYDRELDDIYAAQTATRALEFEMVYQLAGLRPPHRTSSESRDNFSQNWEEWRKALAKRISEGKFEFTSYDQARRKVAEAIDQKQILVEGTIDAEAIHAAVADLGLSSSFTDDYVAALQNELKTKTRLKEQLANDSNLSLRFQEFDVDHVMQVLIKVSHILEGRQNLKDIRKPLVILLSGSYGIGKSRVGKELERLVGFSYYATDDLVPILASEIPADTIPEIHDLPFDAPFDSENLRLLLENHFNQHVVTAMTGSNGKGGINLQISKQVNKRQSIVLEGPVLSYGLITPDIFNRANVIFISLLPEGDTVEERTQTQVDNLKARARDAVNPLRELERYLNNINQIQYLRERVWERDQKWGVQHRWVYHDTRQVVEDVVGLIIGPYSDNPLGRKYSGMNEWEVARRVKLKKDPRFGNAVHFGRDQNKYPTVLIQSQNLPNVSQKRAMKDLLEGVSRNDKVIIEWPNNLSRHRRAAMLYLAKLLEEKEIPVTFQEVPSGRAETRAVMGQNFLYIGDRKGYDEAKKLIEWAESDSILGPVIQEISKRLLLGKPKGRIQFRWGKDMMTSFGLPLTGKKENLPLIGTVKTADHYDPARRETTWISALVELNSGKEFKDERDHTFAHELIEADLMMGLVGKYKLSKKERSFVSSGYSDWITESRLWRLRGHFGWLPNEVLSLGMAMRIQHYHEWASQSLLAYAGHLKGLGRRHGFMDLLDALSEFARQWQLSETAESFETLLSQINDDVSIASMKLAGVSGMFDMMEETRGEDPRAFAESFNALMEKHWEDREYHYQAAAVLQPVSDISGRAETRQTLDQFAQSIQTDVQAAIGGEQGDPWEKLGKLVWDQLSEQAHVMLFADNVHVGWEEQGTFYTWVPRHPESVIHGLALVILEGLENGDSQNGVIEAVRLLERLAPRAAHPELPIIFKNSLGAFFPEYEGDYNPKQKFTVTKEEAASANFSMYKYVSLSHQLHKLPGELGLVTSAAHLMSMGHHFFSGTPPYDEWDILAITEDLKLSLDITQGKFPEGIELTAARRAELQQMMKRSLVRFTVALLTFGSLDDLRTDARFSEFVAFFETNRENLITWVEEEFAEDLKRGFSLASFSHEFLIATIKKWDLYLKQKNLQASILDFLLKPEVFGEHRAFLQSLPERPPDRETQKRIEGMYEQDFSVSFNSQFQVYYRLTLQKLHRTYHGRVFGDNFEWVQMSTIASRVRSDDDRISMRGTAAFPIPKNRYGYFEFLQKVSALLDELPAGAQLSNGEQFLRSNLSFAWDEKLSNAEILFVSPSITSFYLLDWMEHFQPKAWHILDQYGDAFMGLNRTLRNFLAWKPASEISISPVFGHWINPKKPVQELNHQMDIIIVFPPVDNVRMNDQNREQWAATTAGYLKEGGILVLGVDEDWGAKRALKPFVERQDLAEIFVPGERPGRFHFFVKRRAETRAQGNMTITYNLRTAQSDLENAITRSVLKLPILNLSPEQRKTFDEMFEIQPEDAAKEASYVLIFHNYSYITIGRVSPLASDKDRVRIGVQKFVFPTHELMLLVPSTEQSKRRLYEIIQEIQMTDAPFEVRAGPVTSVTKINDLGKDAESNTQLELTYETKTESRAETRNAEDVINDLFDHPRNFMLHHQTSLLQFLASQLLIAIEITEKYGHEKIAQRWKSLFARSTFNKKKIYFAIRNSDELRKLLTAKLTGAIQLSSSRMSQFYLDLQGEWFIHNIEKDFGNLGTSVRLNLAKKDERSEKEYQRINRWRSTPREKTLILFSILGGALAIGISAVFNQLALGIGPVFAVILFVGSKALFWFIHNAFKNSNFMKQREQRQILDIHEGDEVGYFPFRTYGEEELIARVTEIAVPDSGRPTLTLRAGRDVFEHVSPASVRIIPQSKIEKSDENYEGLLLNSDQDWAQAFENNSLPLVVEIGSALHTERIQNNPNKNFILIESDPERAQGLVRMIHILKLKNVRVAKGVDYEVLAKQNGRSVIDEIIVQFPHGDYFFGPQGTVVPKKKKAKDMEAKIQARMGKVFDLLKPGGMVRLLIQEKASDINSEFFHQAGFLAPVQYNGPIESWDKPRLEKVYLERLGLQRIGISGVIYREFVKPARAETRQMLDQELLKSEILNGLGSLNEFVDTMSRLAAQIETKYRGIGILSRLLFEVTKDNPDLRQRISGYRGALLEKAKQAGPSQQANQIALRVLESLGIGSIISISPEVVPFSKAGGMAMVLKDLPKVLQQAGTDNTVITLLYHDKLHKKHLSKDEILNQGITVDGKTIHVEPTGKKVSILVGPDANDSVEAEVFFANLDGVRIFFLYHPEFTNRLYAAGSDADKIKRTIFLSRGSLEVIKEFDLAPHFILAHDWMAAPALAYLKVDPIEGDFDYRKDEHFKDVRLGYVAHNLGRKYQSLFYTTGNTNENEVDLWRYFRLQDQHYFGLANREGEDPNYPHHLNLVRGGIVHSDFVWTVSPKYAEEILTVEQGEGLDFDLGQKADHGHFYGISNGIDLPEFRWRYDQRGRVALGLPPISRENFKLDEFLQNLSRYKEAMKTKVQGKYGFEIDPGSIFVGIIGRLDEQKGIQLIAEEAQRVLDQDDEIQVFIGGPLTEGGAYTEELKSVIQELEKNPRYTGRIRGVFEMITDDEFDLTDVMLAMDLFMMPSLFEPGGLTQLEALAAGTAVVGRKTGGITTTLIDFDEETLQGDGFLFQEYSGAAFRQALLRGSGVLKSAPIVRNAIIKRAALATHDWSDRLSQYMAMLRKESGVLEAHYSYLPSSEQELEQILPKRAETRTQQLETYWQEFIKIHRKRFNNLINNQEVGGIFMSTPKETLADLAKRYPLAPGRKILDVGEAGGLSAFLLSIYLNAEVTGIEIDPDRFAFTQEFQAFLETKGLKFPNVRFVHEDFLDHGLHNYDLVFYFFATPPKYRGQYATKVIEKLQAELKPGALFVSPAFSPDESALQKPRRSLDPSVIIQALSQIEGMEYKTEILAGRFVPTLRKRRAETRTNLRDERIEELLTKNLFDPSLNNSIRGFFQLEKDQQTGILKSKSPLILKSPNGSTFKFNIRMKPDGKVRISTSVSHFDFLIKGKVSEAHAAFFDTSDLRSPQPGLFVEEYFRHRNIGSVMMTLGLYLAWIEGTETFFAFETYAQELLEQLGFDFVSRHANDIAINYSFNLIKNSLPRLASVDNPRRAETRSKDAFRPFGDTYYHRIDYDNLVINTHVPAIFIQYRGPKVTAALNPDYRNPLFDANVAYNRTLILSELNSLFSKDAPFNQYVISAFEKAQKDPVQIMELEGLIDDDAMAYFAFIVQQGMHEAEEHPDLRQGIRQYLVDMIRYTMSRNPDDLLKFRKKYARAMRRFRPYSLGNMLYSDLARRSLIQVSQTVNPDAMVIEPEGFVLGGRKIPKRLKNGESQQYPAEKIMFASWKGYRFLLYTSRSHSAGSMRTIRQSRLYQPGLGFIKETPEYLSDLPAEIAVKVNRIIDSDQIIWSEDAEKFFEKLRMHGMQDPVEYYLEKIGGSNTLGELEATKAEMTSSIDPGLFAGNIQVQESIASKEEDLISSLRTVYPHQKVRFDLNHEILIFAAGKRIFVRYDIPNKRFVVRGQEAPNPQMVLPQQAFTIGKRVLVNGVSATPSGVVIAIDEHVQGFDLRQIQVSHEENVAVIENISDYFAISVSGIPLARAETRRIKPSARMNFYEELRKVVNPNHKDLIGWYVNSAMKIDDALLVGNPSVLIMSDRLKFGGMVERTPLDQQKLRDYMQKAAATHSEKDLKDLIETDGFNLRDMTLLTLESLGVSQEQVQIQHLGADIWRLDFEWKHPSEDLPRPRTVYFLGSHELERLKILPEEIISAIDSRGGLDFIMEKAPNYYNLHIDYARDEVTVEDAAKEIRRVNHLKQLLLKRGGTLIGDNEYNASSNWLDIFLDYFVFLKDKFPSSNMILSRGSNEFANIDQPWSLRWRAALYRWGNGSVELLRRQAGEAVPASQVFRVLPSGPRAETRAEVRRPKLPDFPQGRLVLHLLRRSNLSGWQRVGHVAMYTAFMSTGPVIEWLKFTVFLGALNYAAFQFSLPIWVVVVLNGIHVLWTGSLIRTAAILFVFKPIFGVRLKKLAWNFFPGFGAYVFPVAQAWELFKETHSQYEGISFRDIRGLNEKIIQSLSKPYSGFPNKRRANLRRLVPHLLFIILEFQKNHQEEWNGKWAKVRGSHLNNGFLTSKVKNESPTIFLDTPHRLSGLRSYLQSQGYQNLPFYYVDVNQFLRAYVDTKENLRETPLPLNADEVILPFFNLEPQTAPTKREILEHLLDELLEDTSILHGKAFHQSRRAIITVLMKERTNPLSAIDVIRIFQQSGQMGVNLPQGKAEKIAASVNELNHPPRRAETRTNLRNERIEELLAKNLIDPALRDSLRNFFQLEEDKQTGILKSKAPLVLKSPNGETFKFNIRIKPDGKVRISTHVGYFDLLMKGKVAEAHTAFFEDLDLRTPQPGLFVEEWFQHRNIGSILITLGLYLAWIQENDLFFGFETYAHELLEGLGFHAVSLHGNKIAINYSFDLVQTPLPRLASIDNPSRAETRSLNRRMFLKAVTAAAVGVAASMLPAQPVEAPRPPSKPLTHEEFTAQMAKALDPVQVQLFQKYRRELTIWMDPNKNVFDRQTAANFIFESLAESQIEQIQKAKTLQREMLFMAVLTFNDQDFAKLWLLIEEHSTNYAARNLQENASGRIFVARVFYDRSIFRAVTDFSDALKTGNEPPAHALAFLNVWRSLALKAYRDSPSQNIPPAGIFQLVDAYNQYKLIFEIGQPTKKQFEAYELWDYVKFRKNGSLTLDLAGKRKAEFLTVMSRLAKQVTQDRSIQRRNLRDKGLGLDIDLGIKRNEQIRKWIGIFLEGAENNNDPIIDFVVESSEILHVAVLAADESENVKRIAGFPIRFDITAGLKEAIMKYQGDELNSHWEWALKVLALRVLESPEKFEETRSFIEKQAKHYEPVISKEYFITLDRWVYYLAANLDRLNLAGRQADIDAILDLIQKNSEKKLTYSSIIEFLSKDYGPHTVAFFKRWLDRIKAKGKNSADEKSFQQLIRNSLVYDPEQGTELQPNMEASPFLRASVATLAAVAISEVGNHSEWNLAERIRVIAREVSAQKLADPSTKTIFIFGRLANLARRTYDAQNPKHNAHLDLLRSVSSAYSALELEDENQVTQFRWLLEEVVPHANKEVARILGSEFPEVSPPQLPAQRQAALQKSDRIMLEDLYRPFYDVAFRFVFKSKKRLEGVSPSGAHLNLWWHSFLFEKDAKVRKDLAEAFDSVFLKIGQPVLDEKEIQAAREVSNGMKRELAGDIIRRAETRVISQKQIESFRQSLTYQQEKIIAQILRGKKLRDSIINDPRILDGIDSYLGGGRLTDEELRLFLNLPQDEFLSHKENVFSQLHPGKIQRYQEAWDNLAVKRNLAGYRRNYLRRRQNGIKTVWKKIARAYSIEQIRSFSLGDFALNMGFKELSGSGLMTPSFTQVSQKAYETMRDTPPIEMDFRGGFRAPEEIPYQWWRVPGFNGPGNYFFPEQIQREQSRRVFFYGRNAIIHELLEEEFTKRSVVDPSLMLLGQPLHNDISIIEEELKFAALVGEEEFNNAIHDRRNELERLRRHPGIEREINFPIFERKIRNIIDHANFDQYCAAAEARWAAARRAETRSPLFTQDEIGLIRARGELLKMLYAKLENNNEAKKVLLYPSFLAFFMGIKPAYIRIVGMWTQEPDPRILADAIREIPEAWDHLGFTFGEDKAYEPRLVFNQIKQHREFLERIGALSFMEDEPLLSEIEQSIQDQNWDSFGKGVEKLLAIMFQRGLYDMSVIYAVRGIMLGFPEPDIQASIDRYVKKKFVNTTKPERLFEDLGLVEKVNEDGDVSEDAQNYMARMEQTLIYAYSLIRDSQDFKQIAHKLELPHAVFVATPSSEFSGRAETRAIRDYEIKTEDIVNPAEFWKQFGRDRIVVDIGLGDGRFLIRTAKEQIGNNGLVVGLDIPVPQKMPNEIQALRGQFATNLKAEGPLENLRVLFPAAGGINFTDLFAENQIDEIYLFFPYPYSLEESLGSFIDPGTSLIWRDFLSRLKPGGSLHLVTDSKDYAAKVQETLRKEPDLDAMAEVFEESQMSNIPPSFPRSFISPVTDHVAETAVYLKITRRAETRMDAHVLKLFARISQIFPEITAAEWKEIEALNLNQLALLAQKLNAELADDKLLGRKVLEARLERISSLILSRVSKPKQTNLSILRQTQKKKAAGKGQTQRRNVMKGKIKGKFPGKFPRRAETRNNYISLDRAYQILREIEVESTSMFDSHPLEVRLRDLDYSLDLARDLENRRIQKVMVIGWSQKNLPMLLALTGKQVDFVDLNHMPIEFNKERIEKVKVKLSGTDYDLNLRLTMSEIGALDFKAHSIKPHTYDLVTFIDLIGNMGPKGQPKRWLMTARKALRKEGYFLIDEKPGKRTTPDQLLTTHLPVVFKKYERTRSNKKYLGFYYDAKSRNHLYHVSYRRSASTARAETRTDYQRALDKVAALKTGPDVFVLPVYHNNEGRTDGTDDYVHAIEATEEIKTIVDHQRTGPDYGKRAHILTRELVWNLIRNGHGSAVAIHTEIENDQLNSIKIIGMDSGEGIEDPNFIAKRSVSTVISAREAGHYMGGAGFFNYFKLADQVILESKGKRWEKESLGWFRYVGASEVEDGTRITLIARVDSDIEERFAKREKEREAFFLILDVLNHKWWFLEEHKLADGSIADAGYHDKTALNIENNMPKRTTVYLWDDKEFEQKKKYLFGEEGNPNRLGIIKDRIRMGKLEFMSQDEFEYTNRLTEKMGFSMRAETRRSVQKPSLDSMRETRLDRLGIATRTASSTEVSRDSTLDKRSLTSAISVRNGKTTSETVRNSPLSSSINTATSRAENLSSNGMSSSFGGRPQFIADNAQKVNPNSAVRIAKFDRHANEIIRHVRTDEQPANIFIDADDFPHLSASQKNEYLYAALSRNQLRIIVYNEHGQVQSPELQTLLKLEHVMRTNKGLNEALSAFTRPNTPNLHFSKRITPNPKLFKNRAFFFKQEGESAGVLAVALLWAVSDEKNLNYLGVSQGFDGFLTVAEFVISSLQRKYNTNLALSWAA